MAKKKQGKPKKRSGTAVAAMHRKGGPMKHRLEPKGGSKNKQAEALQELIDDLQSISDKLKEQIEEIDEENMEQEEFEL